MSQPTGAELPDVDFVEMLDGNQLGLCRHGNNRPLARISKSVSAQGQPYAREREILGKNALILAKRRRGHDNQLSVDTLKR